MRLEVKESGAAMQSRVARKNMGFYMCFDLRRIGGSRRVIEIISMQHESKKLRNTHSPHSIDDPFFVTVHFNKSSNLSQVDIFPVPKCNNFIKCKQ